MRFTSIIAIAAILLNVEAIEVHNHQKSASGAHIRKQQHPTALAQAQADEEWGFNFDKFKQKADTMKRKIKE